MFEIFGFLISAFLQHMRTFPNVWVPPGGGIELDEGLRETGLRELYEEAGLKLEQSDVVEEGPLCLWESCFPQTLSRGDNLLRPQKFFLEGQKFSEIPGAIALKKGPGNLS